MCIGVDCRLALAVGFPTSIRRFHDNIHTSASGLNVCYVEGWLYAADLSMVPISLDCLCCQPASDTIHHLCFDNIVSYSGTNDVTGLTANVWHNSLT